MTVRQKAKQILDTLLLPNGITSHFLRRTDVDTLPNGKTPNNDEYVVYRVVTGGGRVYGDGNAVLRRTTFDVNYYYNNANIDAYAGEARADTIIAAFKAAGWQIVNGQSDLYDNIDNNYDGINIEVTCIEAVAANG